MKKDKSCFINNPHHKILGLNTSTHLKSHGKPIELYVLSSLLKFDKLC